jgi:membrane associated rhomboid family serine protease
MSDGAQPKGKLGSWLTGPSQATAILILLNVAAFLANLLGEQVNAWATQYLAVAPAMWWQAWRYVTFQFVHANLMHLVLNMLGLYFLGRPVEWEWGHRRFVIFYLLCGAAAGVIHTIFSQAMGQPGVYLVGASGGVYGIVVACAILLPRMRIYVLIFPMSMRTAALVFLGISVLGLLGNFWSGRGEISNAAHLGGALAAWLWLWVLPRLRPAGRPGVGEGRWERKMQAERRSQAGLDRILDKVRQKGLDSLSWWEKRTLRRATQRQRELDRRNQRQF